MANPGKRIAARAAAKRLSGNGERYWKIVNVGNRTVRLDLDGVIGESLWEEGIGAKAIRREIEAFSDIALIDVYLTTPGGSIREGLAIRSFLAGHEADVRVTVTGFAASMGSVVATSASPGNLFMMPGTMQMIHDPMADGGKMTAEQHRKTAEALDKAGQGLVDIYAARNSVVDRAEIERMMAEETWMTAPEAIELGFADSMSDSVEPAMVAMFNPAMFGDFNKLTLAASGGSSSKPKEVQTMTEEKKAADSTPAESPEKGTPSNVVSLDKVRELVAEEVGKMGDTVSLKTVEALTAREKLHREVRELFAPFEAQTDLMNKAIADGWSVDASKAALFDALNGEKTGEISPDGLNQSHTPDDRDEVTKVADRLLSRVKKEA